jgi:molybdopterin-guanine dinucleotide biosynthesis protein MobB
MKYEYPAFGICGYSGSGKTTVIEKIIAELTRRKLRVGVVKHDVHGLNIDHEGKDTDRFFKAGADVVIRGPEQCFFRGHRRGDISLHELFRMIGPYYDLILVEGHKGTPLEQKVWLCGDAGEEPPAEATGIHRVLKRDEDRFAIVMDMIDEWLPRSWRATPVYAGILIGGKSSRMGTPRHLLRADGKTWVERIVETVQPHVDGIAILGAGDIPESLHSLPVLCDVPNAKGPLAGMLAAARWMPLSSWVFMPCDLPLLAGAALRWLLDQRGPGVWAVLPQLTDAPAPEPLLAYYDFRMASAVERVRRPRDLMDSPGVATPTVPGDLAPAWRNVNSPADVMVSGRETNANEP